MKSFISKDAPGARGHSFSFSATLTDKNFSFREDKNISVCSKKIPEIPATRPSIYLHLETGKILILICIEHFKAQFNKNPTRKYQQGAKKTVEINHFIGRIWHLTEEYKPSSASLAKMKRIWWRGSYLKGLMRV